MEIRTLRYFLAVAREENMTKAADILHVTQPTLSKTMKSLENELGKKLFTRHSFSIALTDEGMLLRDRAEDLVMMADKIEKSFCPSTVLRAANSILALRNPIIFAIWPERFTASKSVIRVCNTTSPAEIRSR